MDISLSILFYFDPGGQENNNGMKKSPGSAFQFRNNFNGRSKN
jgi:hypothetical protein